MSADERVLLERKYLKGEPVRALAVEWEMSEKAMESHLLRIRRKLKAAMLGRLQDEKKHYRITGRSAGGRRAGGISSHTAGQNLSERAPAEAGAAF
jgi:hypothetical protein